MGGLCRTSSFSPPYMAIDNQYFPLFSSIHENSTKNEILCRGGLIMIYFLFMVILIIQELLRF